MLRVIVFGEHQYSRLLNFQKRLKWGSARVSTRELYHNNLQSKSIFRCGCGNRAFIKYNGFHRRFFGFFFNNSKNVKNISSNETKLKEVQRIWTLAQPERRKIGGAVMLLLISSSISISIPFLIGKLIDIMYTSLDTHTEIMSTLHWTCLGLSAVFFVGALANGGRLYFIQNAGQNIIKRLRQKLFASIASQEMAFFDRKSSGELITRLSSDTVLVGNALTNNLSDGMRASVQAIGGVALMVYTCPKLTAVALSVVPPVVVLSIIYGRFLRNITTQVQDKLADSSRHADERFSNMQTVRAFAREESEMKIYNSVIDGVYKLSTKEAFARAIFFGFNGFSGNVIALLVLYNGGAMMADSQITVGNLTAFLMYTVYVGFSLSGLSTFYTELMKGIGASTRIWEMMDKRPLIPLHGGFNIHDVIKSQSISFTDVGFTYPARPNVEILKHFDLNIPSGSVTAIVGESGSGKSTTASLLLRHYDIDAGAIKIGDQDIKSLDPSSLREYIGTVSQEPILFSMTIAENISYGLLEGNEVKFDDIVDAAKQANAHNFVINFPDGFNTVVGERGQMLSGGQRQRIAIARAIIKNPKILLLDEATSALDAESEHLVRDALQKLMVNRTTVIIAHRLSTIKSADQIAVLQNGRISEIGSYQTLMAIPDGAFKQLVEKQSFDS